MVVDEVDRLNQKLQLADGEVEAPPDDKRERTRTTMKTKECMPTPREKLCR